MFRTPAPGQPSSSVSITEPAPCQKAVRVQVGSAAIGPIRAAVLAEFQKAAALPGFRKGKAPAEAVERQHAKAIQDETLQRAARQTLEQVARDHQLKPVGPFEIRRADFSEADGLSLEAVVEVEPAFPLAAYKRIALTRRPVAVGAAELDQALQTLRESMAQMAPAASGEGAKERQLPALDDELAKDLGFKTLQELTAHVKAKLTEQQQAAQAEALTTGLYDELLRRHTFQVPAGLVSRQTDRLQRDFLARLLMSGVAEQDAPKQLEQFTEQLRTSAERHVKLAFILERIAEQEQVSVTQDEVVGRLWQLSKSWKKDPGEVRKLFDERGLWPSVISSIRNEKTTARLLAAADVRDGAPPSAAAPTAPAATTGGRAP